MFTVTVGFDWSGKSSTLRPLGRRYSVMPSTVVTLVGVLATFVPGSCGGTRRCSALGLGVTFAVGLAAGAVVACAKAMAGMKAQTASRRAAKDVMEGIRLSEKEMINGGGVELRELEYFGMWPPN